MAPSRQQRDLSSAELFRQYGEFVARFLYRLGVPADAIDDTVQEVFLVAHQRGGYRSGPAKPTTYLGVIATHAAATHRRRARTHAARASSAPPEELSWQGPDPEHDLETRDQLRRLQAALDKLDPDLRATLLLADAEGETCVDIGKAMGTPVGTVYWRLSEARRRFKRALTVVDAAEQRAAARHAASEPRRLPARAWAESMGVLMMVFGWRSSKAYALLRDTAQHMPGRYDVETGLQRYTETLEKQPATEAATSLAPPPVAAASLGGVKLALGGLGVGAVLAVAAVQWAHGPEANEPSARAANGSAPTPAQQANVQATAAAPVPVDEAPDTPAASSVAGAHEATGEDSTARAIDDADGRGIRTPRRTPRARRRIRNHAGPTRSTGTATPTPGASAARGARVEDDESFDAQHAPPTSPTPADEREARISEVQALGRAQALLPSNPSLALTLVRQVGQSSANTYLEEERRYIEVMALFGMGERHSAERAARAFVKAYPHSAFRAQLQRAEDGAR